MNDNTNKKEDFIELSLIVKIENTQTHTHKRILSQIKFQSYRLNENGACSCMKVVSQNFPILFIFQRSSQDNSVHITVLYTCI